MHSVKLLLLLITFSIGAQEYETILESDFAVRDFCKTNDSLFYLKKRDINYMNDSSDKTDSYFIGGYGVKMFVDKNSGTIITASNELFKLIASVKFYNLTQKKIENVFYYRNGKIIDFLVIPEAKLFVMSLTNNKIVFISYSNVPKFRRVIEIPLESFSRKMIFKDNNLFFATDKGYIYKYNINENKKRLLVECNKLITDFVLDSDNIVYSTIDGGLTKVNTINNEKKGIKLNTNFISTLLLHNRNKLICGTWKGHIYIINYPQFTIDKKLEVHSRSVLKIKNNEKSIFYSSGLDKTIKKWDLEKTK